MVSIIPGGLRIDPNLRRRSVSNRILENYQRLPSVLVLWGVILLMYVVVSTAKGRSWFQGVFLDARIEGVLPELGMSPSESHEKQHPFDTPFRTNSSSTLQLPGFDTASSQARDEFAIFYNVYIPHDQGDKGVRRSLDIVREQIDTIGNSYAAKFSDGTPVTVYYNTIGKQGALNSTYMLHVCSERNKIVCVQMDHHDVGFEELTLQHLFDYCVYQEDDWDPKVLYLHNKGSYHDRNGANTRWRRHMMMAITSDLCLKPLDDVCSACGLIFYDVWALIYPGNFWTARCSYVKKLIPPMHFNASMTKMFEERQTKIDANPIFATIFPNISRLQEYGTNRFAPEQWLGSHPSLVPCDLAGQFNLDEWRLVDRTPHDLTWNTLPRPLQTIGQYKMLLGNLFKWFNLYSEFPPDDSYAWKVFPDGEQIKQAVKIYGNQAVDIAVEMETVKELASSVGMNH